MKGCDILKKILVIVFLILTLIFTSGSTYAISISVDEYNDLTESVVCIDDATTVSAELLTFAKSVVLMEKSTGKVLYSENENEKLFPASVTKIMSILLVCEALQDGKINLDDEVVCSENAASKGGSQIWLEPGEKMTVHDLLKATCVYSANDACTLLGEYVAGSETAFNDLMNEKAEELGMDNTHFDNCTGLDDTTDTHLTTAMDVALMSRELLLYDFIKDYTTTWMDSLRNGETQLVNTNKLVRFYDGITGLKTGTTEKAGCCVSASAERNGMELIAVVMGSKNSNDRFASAQNLLDWGFANFELYTPCVEDDKLTSINVILGENDFVSLCMPELPSILINKGDAKSVVLDINLDDYVEAPVVEGQTVGSIKIYNNDKLLAEYTIDAAENVAKLNFFGSLLKLLTSFST